MHPMMDKFIHIIEENRLKAEDIEKVEVTPHCIGLNRAWKENSLATEDDFKFHGPYLLACAAHRLKGIDYHNPGVRNDAKIREFINKVTILPNPHEDFGLAILKNGTARVHNVEVRAKGTIFKERIGGAKWSRSPEGRRPSNEELVEKFKELVSGLLPSGRIDKATMGLLELEKFENVNDLMVMFRP